MQAIAQGFGKALGRMAALAVVMAAPAGPMQAEVAIETATLGDHTVTLYLHPFLTDEDLMVLRFVTTSPDALALFLPTASGHAAIAVSPDEGFVRAGAPMPAVVALGGLPDAQTARSDSLAACQKAAPSAAPCVVVLDIAPN